MSAKTATQYNEIMNSILDSKQSAENIHLEFEVDLPPGESLEILINCAEQMTTQTENGDIIIQPVKRPHRFNLKHITRSIKSALRRLQTTPLPLNENWLFLFALTMYIITRLIALTDFPLSFTAREAAASVAAAELLQNRFHGSDGTLLPTFFSDGQTLSLGTSVYLRAIWIALFGQSLWLTRLFSMFSSLLVVWGLTYWLKNGFQLKSWWVVPLLLAATPGWFIPSRSALDLTLLTALYVAALAAYLRYRRGSPGWLYGAVGFAALAFYTSPPGRILIPLVILILLVMDFSYHRQQGVLRWRVSLLLIVLILPLVRFLWSAPGDILTIDWLLPGSLWSNPQPPVIGLHYLQHFWEALNPISWFLPLPVGMDVYSLPLYGALGWATFPFLLIGFWLVLRKAGSSPPASLALVGWLAVPFAIAIFWNVRTIALLMLPFWILFIALGLEKTLNWLEQYRHNLKLTLTYLLMVGLSVSSVTILLDTLRNSPRWYSDYGRNGLQYGSEQIFRLARDYALYHPDMTIRISPVWCTQCETLRAFFIPDNPKILLDPPSRFMESPDETIVNNVFIVTKEEYLTLVESRRFGEINVKTIVPFPDGSPAFFLLRLNY